MLLQPLLAVPVVAHVWENRDPGEYVTQVQACDLDEAPYNTVYYEIIRE